MRQRNGKDGKMEIEERTKYLLRYYLILLIDFVQTSDTHHMLVKLSAVKCFSRIFQYSKIKSPLNLLLIDRIDIDIH